MILTPYDDLKTMESMISSPRFGENSLSIIPESNKQIIWKNPLSRIQFLLTWANRTNSSIVSIPDTSLNYQNSLEGIFLSYSMSKILSITNLDLRPQFLSSARCRIKEMYSANFSNAVSDGEIDWAFIAGSQNEFHGSFYKKAPTYVERMSKEKHGQLVRTKYEIDLLLKRCYRELNILPNGFDDYSIATALHEAFRNTAEHGYTGSDGHRLRLNFRCVRISKMYLPFSLEYISRCIGSNDDERNLYFNKLINLNESCGRNNIPMLEVSVFDSGIGFPSTISEELSRDDINSNDLTDYCFRKYVSSKPQRTSGLGLGRIIDSIGNIGGMVRIRTSNVEMSYFGNGNGLKCNYKDGSMDGSLINIAIPIRGS